MVDIQSKRAQVNEMQRKLDAAHNVTSEKRQWAQGLLDDSQKDVDEMARLQVRLDALKSLLPWYKLESHQIERNDCSRLHKLHEAMLARRVILKDNNTSVHPGDRVDELLRDMQSFVVQHDWASAFANATDYAEGEFNLPYSQCAFEFRISGRTVIVLAYQPTEEMLASLPGKYERIMAIPYVECGGYWWCREELGRDDPSLQYVWSQIRAISIALDAEVATRDVMRAPAALNEKRLKRGDPPLYDFHVVKLHGRVVRQQLPSDGGTHRSPRLHFRRGHWRHYEKHNTWIRWTLVGNPELGFIDKAYRL